MPKKELFRSVLIVEILSETELPDSVCLEKIITDNDNGESSLKLCWKQQNHLVVGKQAAKQVEKHGTDYDFFCMDCNGHVVDDDDDIE